MKVEVKSKKGLRTVLSVIVDKNSIKTKMEEKLSERQKEVTLKFVALNLSKLFKVTLGKQSI